MSTAGTTLGFLYDEGRMLFCFLVSGARRVSLRLIETKTGQAGNFKRLIFSTHRKSIGEFVFCLERSSYHTGIIVQIEYPARQSGSVCYAQCHTPRPHSKTGGSMDLALWLLPVAITCCFEGATGQLVMYDINTCYLYQTFSQVDGPL